VTLTAGIVPSLPASETLNVYSHLWPDTDDDTREAVDLVLGLRVSDRVSHLPS